MCRCVSRDSGGSSAQHVPGKFCHHPCEEREKSGGKEGKSGDRWRRAIKREGTRGNMRDRGDMGGTDIAEERG